MDRSADRPWKGDPMLNRTPIHCIILIVMATSLFGCAAGQYNGAWDMGANQEELAQKQAALAQLEKQKSEYWRRMAEAQAKQPPQTDRHDTPTFLAATDPGLYGPGPHGIPSVGESAKTATAGLEQGGMSDDGTMPVNFTSEPEDHGFEDVGDPSQPVRPFGSLGLYGEIPDAGGPSTTVSPLDEAGNLAQLTTATEGGDFDPDVDPTGNWLAFSSTRHRKTSDIYIQMIGGSTVRQLTTHAADDQMPCFSPDGRSIAFCSNRNGNWDVYLVSTEGGKPQQLTTAGTHDIHPSFSPDGKKLVYSSFGSRSGQWELWVLDVDNPAARRHVGYGLFPKWSPTDDRIVFQRARQRGVHWFSIWTIDLENGEAKRPTEIAASSNAAAITPSWAPNGQFIVFCTVLHPDQHQSGQMPKADVWITDLQGQSRTNLTQSKYTDAQPVWTSNGRVVFVSNRAKSGTGNIWSIVPNEQMRLVMPHSAPGNTRTVDGTDGGVIGGDTVALPEGRDDESP